MRLGVREWSDDDVRVNAVPSSEISAPAARAAGRVRLREPQDIIDEADAAYEDLEERVMGEA